MRKKRITRKNKIKKYKGGGWWSVLTGQPTSNDALSADRDKKRNSLPTRRRYIHEENTTPLYLSPKLGELIGNFNEITEKTSEMIKNPSLQITPLDMLNKTIENKRRHLVGAVAHAKGMEVKGQAGEKGNAINQVVLLTESIKIKLSKVAALEKEEKNNQLELTNILNTLLSEHLTGNEVLTSEDLNHLLMDGIKLNNLYQTVKLPPGRNINSIVSELNEKIGAIIYNTNVPAKSDGMPTIKGMADQGGSRSVSRRMKYKKNKSIKSRNTRKKKFLNRTVRRRRRYIK